MGFTEFYKAVFSDILHNVNTSLFFVPTKGEVVIDSIRNYHQVSTSPVELAQQLDSYWKVSNVHEHCFGFRTAPVRSCSYPALVAFSVMGTVRGWLFFNQIPVACYPRCSHLIKKVLGREQKHTT